MVRADSYTPDLYRYECVSCGFRRTTDDPMGTCPECDGTLRNLAVPRE
jgi:predicted nucleic acid-binding Zn ribbon protein